MDSSVLPFPRVGGLAPPLPRQLFEDNPIQNFQALKAALVDMGRSAKTASLQGEIAWSRYQGIIKSERGQQLELLEKMGLTPDKIKEWELGTPIPTTPVQSTGITPYNVESALLMLIPKELQLRNKTPREKGIGQGLEYRRLTALNNSGGAQPELYPFFSSTSNTVTINGVTLNRPPLIAYSGDTTFKAFVEMGFTDSVSVQQQFASQGFTDAQAISMLALLWTDMLGEERSILKARSTVLGITSFAATVAADSTATSAGLPSGTATAVYITASSSMGESQAITCTGTPTVSAVSGVKVTAFTDVPVGTLAINVYVNMTGTYYKGTTPFTVAGAYGAGASPKTFSVVSALPSTSVDNGSYSSLAYDGMITEYNNSALSGYQLALNAALNTSNPGTEFETALTQLYVTQGADVDAIYTTGSIASALYDLLKNNAQNVSYRINLQTGENGVVMGGSVGGVVNPATSKMVDLLVHRYMPNGIAALHSWTVPWADSGITSCMKVVNTVDTMVIDWPQIGMSYDRSTYRYGTLIFEAPVLAGIITNINN
jgi:hypothetical protein